MHKREFPRLELPHIQADVSDGKGFFTGAVINVSRFGLAIGDISSDLDQDSDIYSVIIDGPGTHFKLLVRPVWVRDDGNSKTIGAIIENSPWTWTDFVMTQETHSPDMVASQSTN